MIPRTVCVAVAAYSTVVPELIFLVLNDGKMVAVYVPSLKVPLLLRLSVPVAVS